MGKDESKKEIEQKDLTKAVNEEIVIFLEQHREMIVKRALERLKKTRTELFTTEDTDNEPA